MQNTLEASDEEEDAGFHPPTALSTVAQHDDEDDGEDENDDNEESDDLDALEEEDEEDDNKDVSDEERPVADHRISDRTSPEPPESEKPHDNNDQQQDNDNTVEYSLLPHSSTLNTITNDTSSAPSVLQEEKNAREHTERTEQFDDESDPDTIRDKDEFTKQCPIIRQMGKSMPCYRAPFDSCIHMPFLTETGKPIEPFTMTAEQYCEQIGKNKETTEEIFATLSPSKVAQQVCIFAVHGGKTPPTGGERRSAAFIRVSLSNFENATPGLEQLLSGGLPLYQLHAKTFTDAFKAERGMLLPKSVSPSSKGIEYLRLSPKTEAEVSPSGWIMCASVGESTKSGKRTHAAKDRPDLKKAKHHNGTSNKNTSVVPDDEYAYVADPATWNVGSSSSSGQKKSDDDVSSSLATQGVSGSEHLAKITSSRYEQCEEACFDIGGLSDWPAFRPSFPFDPAATEIKVQFKVITYR